VLLTFQVRTGTDSQFLRNIMTETDIVCERLRKINPRNTARGYYDGWQL
jgi:predicted nucleotidyltransferase component of viral defense system